MNVSEKKKSWNWVKKMVWSWFYGKIIQFEWCNFHLGGFHETFCGVELWILLSWFHEKFLKLFYSTCLEFDFTKKIVKSSYRTQCGNYENVLSSFFGKKLVKATHLLNKSLKSWFDGKTFGESKFFIFPQCHSAVWKFRKFSVKLIYSITF